MEYLYGIIFILFLFVVIYQISKRVEFKEDLNFIDIVQKHNLNKDNSVKDEQDVITKLQHLIAMDLHFKKVKPLSSINDNNDFKLDTFISKGNVGFYTYFRGVTVPKYYVRKVKDETKIITFIEGEQITTFLRITYTEFVQGIITILNNLK